MLADMEKMRASLDAEKRRSEAAAIDKENTAHQLKETEKAWDMEHMRQKCATQEVDKAQITLGSLQNDPTYAHREIFDLRAAVEDHLMAAQHQAEWIRKHKLEIDEMKRINDNVTDESKQRDLESELP